MGDFEDEGEEEEEEEEMDTTGGEVDEIVFELFSSSNCWFQCCTVGEAKTPEENL